jgi:uncharacterized protein DUF6088
MMRTWCVLVRWVARIERLTSVAAKIPDIGICQKYVYISDTIFENPVNPGSARTKRVSAIAETILKHTEGLEEGEVLSAKTLLHLGSRAAVDQALSRLARAGHLLRVGWGLYAPAVRSRFGTRAPRPERVVEGIAALTGETVARGGAAEANALGLSLQVPVRAVYLTSGPNRHITLGCQVVEFRHAPRWRLFAPNQPAGKAVRALSWLGPRHASEAAETLKGKLPLSERQALLRARAQMPSWLAELVSRTFSEEAAGLLANP